MKLHLFALLLTLSLLLAACAQTQAAAPEALTAQAQSSLDQAVQATLTAQAQAQSSLDQAVQATLTAQAQAQSSLDQAVQATLTAQAQAQSSLDQAVQATLTAQPTPDYATLSEEELAALIEEAVNQAVSASAQSAEAASQSASDGSISAEDITATYQYIYSAEAALAYADELINAYYDYYGEYAEAALTELQQMEEDLSALAASVEEINALLAQGAEAATAALQQVNAAAQQAQAHAQQMQTQAAAWQQQIQTSLQQREEQILNLAPTEIATDRAGTINQAHDFLAAFQTALGDGKFSPQELQNIGQLSANLRASFEKFGGRGGEFGGLQASVENLTRQAARGDWGRARSGAADFQRNLPTRPARPPRP